MGVLNRKVAIVTGASSGIGEASALQFAREGASVVVVARGEGKLRQLVERIEAAGGRSFAVVGDVTDETTAERAVAAAVTEYGGLDIAFNNAGATGEMARVDELSPSAWSHTVETNLTSAFLGARHQVPAMIDRGGGSIVFTGTFVGHTVGMPGMAAYAASKSGLIGLTRVLAVELGGHGIRVNAILPGGTDTPASITNAPGAGPEVLAFVEGLHALKRLASPDEIARVVLHLASDASSFTTGTALLADGGVSISKT